MSRLGRRSNNNTYGAATAKAQELCSAVIRATVPTEWTIKDLLETSLSPDHLRILREAHKIVEQRYPYGFDCVHCVVATNGLTRVDVGLHWKTLDLATPQSAIGMQIVHPAIVATVQHIAEVTAAWRKVEDVIAFCDLHSIKPATVRYYWPAMLALLPEQHPVHNITATSARQSIPGDKLALFRETSATVAAAQVLPQTPNEEATVRFIINDHIADLAIPRGDLP